MKDQHNAGRKRSEPLDNIDKSNDMKTSETLSDKHEKQETTSGNSLKPELSAKSETFMADDLVLVQETKDPKSLHSQPSDKLTIKQIIKNLFRSIIPNDTGVAIAEDPIEKKKRSLKYKLRRLFLQNPDLDEAKYHDIDDDTMVEDFVYVDPETPTETDIENIRKDSMIAFVAGSVGSDTRTNLNSRHQVGLVLLARVLQICLCQPFDTLKVKQQTFPQVYRNMFRCLMLTYHKDGIFRGLYAGTMPAMVASLAEHSILFVAYGSSQATIASALEIESTHELSVFGNGCAGSLAAFFSTLALCPTELVKCKLQSIQEMKSYVPMEGKIAAITPYRLTKQIFQNEEPISSVIARLMDRQQNNERSANWRKGQPWIWNYLQYLSDRNKQKDFLYSKQNSDDDGNQEAVTPETPDNTEKAKRNNKSENGETDSFHWVEEPLKEPNEFLDQETENEDTDKDKPKKRNIFKKLFRTIISEDVEVDGFIWLEDESEKKKRGIKNKLRRHFLKNPEPDEAKVHGDNDTLVEDFDLIDPETTTTKVKESAIKHGLIDFVSGSIAGVVQVYVSQPFDTVKVKQQTFPKLYRNMFQCFMRTYSKDGIFRGLYAGTVPAVVASISENSVLFAAYGACQSAVAAAMDIDNVQELSVLGNACAGSLAAFFSTLTLCPTELVKCKLQAIQEMKPYVAKDSKVTAITPYQLTRQIYYNEGIAGFYRGLSSTFAREIPGFFFFFGSYEATREYLTKEGESKDDIGAWKTMLAGSVGGVTLWTSTFPADVIKSRIQIKNLKSSMMTVAFDIVKKEGVLALYNGLLPSILRTIPATATLFLVYEYTKKIMKDNL